MNPARLVAAWLACVAVLVGGAGMAQTTSRDERPNRVISREGPDEEIPSVEEEALDELVAESELQQERQARSRRQKSNNDVDFVAITRHSRAGNGAINLRIQPYSPQREIRLRASDARQLAEGTNSRLKLQRDRITTSGSPIGDVVLTFAAGRDEADGLPAVIEINATASLFNFDYARVYNSTQPLIATLKNVIDPETLRCSGELNLGVGAEEFHDPFVLLGNNFGSCDRIVKSRERDLVFADAVPQRLRQELRSLHDPVYNQFVRDLGAAPGIVFVVWQPKSPRNDFRLVRSLNRTSLLVFNGPSWEQGFTAQQRDALRESIAQEQMQRRIRGGDVIMEAAAEYLLKLARAQRQQATNRMLTAEVPEWIAACARSITLGAGVANVSGGSTSHDCAMVVQFVYDAVARTASKGEGNVMHNWRTLLVDPELRKQGGVSASAFLGSSADAHRIVQGLLSGAVDWTTFTMELGKVGVQLSVTAGQIAPSVEVLSLADFRD